MSLADSNVNQATLGGAKPKRSTKNQHNPALYEDTFVNQDNTRAHVKEVLLHIDSRYRDRLRYPKSNQFQVKFNNLKNIKQIEFISASYPNVTGILNQPYLALTIPEFENTVYEQILDSDIKDMFAKLTPFYVQSGFIYSFNENFNNQKEIYYANGKKLDRLTLEFRKPNGDLFDFGSDTTLPTDVDDTVQVSMTLKITLIEPNII